MDYFKINKYSVVDENILYIAKNLIEILASSDKTFGKVMELYKSRYSQDMNFNIETNVYLAMCLLYGTGKISLDGNLIRLEVK
jgi:hypothetical protein